MTIYIVHGCDLLTQLISIKFPYEADDFLRQSFLNAKYRFLTLSDLLKCLYFSGFKLHSWNVEGDTIFFDLSSCH